MKTFVHFITYLKMWKKLDKTFEVMAHGSARIDPIKKQGEY